MATGTDAAATGPDVAAAVMAERYAPDTTTYRGRVFAAMHELLRWWERQPDLPVPWSIGLSGAVGTVAELQAIGARHGREVYRGQAVSLGDVGRRAGGAPEVPGVYVAASVRLQHAEGSHDV